MWFLMSVYTVHVTTYQHFCHLILVLTDMCNIANIIFCDFLI